jgi:hypothetical protein
VDFRDPAPKLLSRARPAAVLARLRRRGAQEDGVVLAFVAIMMVVILGMAAMAIDIGSYYAAQRRAQAAADAAALAASQDLPSNPTGAYSDAQTYGLKNYPGATVTPQSPYNGSTSQIHVTVTGSTPSFFGRIFGLTSETVSASATAGEHGHATQAAIFAYADGGNCNDMGIQIDKNNAAISGAIQSNGKITDNGLGTSNVGAGVFGTGCSFNGNSQHYGTTPFASNPTGYPLDYRLNPPTCTVTVSGNYTFPSTAYPNPLAPGVYCNTNGTINLSGATGTGVTFEANHVTDTGGTDVSAPLSNGTYGLLLYQTGSDAAAGQLTINGNQEVLNGTIFAPIATVDIQQNNASTGFIEANNVHIEFNNFTITGDGPVVPGTGGGLTG